MGSIEIGLISAGNLFAVLGQTIASNKDHETYKKKSSIRFLQNKEKKHLALLLSCFFGSHFLLNLSWLSYFLASLLVIAPAYHWQQLNKYISTNNGHNKTTYAKAMLIKNFGLALLFFGISLWTLSLNRL